MRNLKKILALVLALVMSLSLVTIANAADFKDADEIDYEEAVAVMSAIGVIEGMDDGNFDPDGILTREQAAKLVTYMMLGDNADKLDVESSSFNDVAVTRWSAPAIEYCVSLGLIDGAGDGNFYPSGKLTGYAFAKLLLTAIGYDSKIEGFTGTGWTINVATLAMEVGLDDGLENGITSAELTRQEAAQMALNAIKTPLVAYKGGTTIIVNGAEVSFGSGDAYYVTTTLAKEQRISKQTLTNSNEYTVEFGERYFPNLSLSNDNDAFERPARTWTYKNETIGTYVDYATRVKSYTSAVTGKEMYELLSKSVIDKYGLTVFVDGYAVNGITKDHLVRSNSRDLAYTGKGVLTEVFVDHDSEEITITCINTYLAKALSDYNEKTDKVTFEVFAYDNASTVHAMDKTETSNMTVLGEDFAMVEDILEDDIVLVNIAQNEIQIINDPEVVSNTKLSAFSKGSKVVAGGETYEYAATAMYDTNVLDVYDNQNLAEATYNLYLDSHGYMIGIDLVEDANTYVFITGVDVSGSNTATAPATATAIFTDGTMETIKVDVEDSTFASGKHWIDDLNDNGDDADSRALVNTWYSYKVNSDDVYTLTHVSTQAQTVYSGSNGSIDRANIGLNADAGDTTMSGGTIVYGNADTNYITVGLKKLNSTAIISKVKSVNTGIKNTDLEVYTKQNAWDTVDGVSGEPTNMSEGVYALYNSNGYVVAAIVIGKDAASVENTFYALEGVNYEEYTDGKYYWSVKGIMNGEETVIRETGDWGDLKVLANVKAGDLFTVGFNADGFVTEKTPISDKAVSAAGPDDVISQALSSADLNMKGWTLYLTSTPTDGIVVADECPTALVETIDGKTVVTYYDDTAAAIKAMQDSTNVNGRLIATLDSNKMATSVIIIDTDEQGTIVPPATASDGTETNTTVVDVDTLTVKVYERTGETANVLGAARAALEAAGYTVLDETYASPNYQLKVSKDGKTQTFITNKVTLGTLTIKATQGSGGGVSVAANSTVYLAAGQSVTVDLYWGSDWSTAVNTGFNTDDDSNLVVSSATLSSDKHTYSITLTAKADMTSTKDVEITWS